eukprot:GHVU01202002.1.p4 GENE.GHVU01202002.1~~GHVU01202002.1.p4  ORF type:complete len:148 (+),score=30.01 GHVU01202002.1:877-1320(+)
MLRGYPRLTPTPSTSWGRFTLAAGLYYPNALEAVISTLETQAVAARVAARHLLLSLPHPNSSPTRRARGRSAATATGAEREGGAARGGGGGKTTERGRGRQGDAGVGGGVDGDGGGHRVSQQQPSNESKLLNDPGRRVVRNRPLEEL